MLERLPKIDFPLSTTVFSEVSRPLPSLLSLNLHCLANM